MKTETSRIVNLLKDTYQGEPWHGPSVKHILQGVTAQQAITKPFSQSHTIWEIVKHMTAWRNFVWQKLAGDTSFDIIDPLQDWPPVIETDEKGWQTDIHVLDNSQHTLLQALAKMEDEKLNEMVLGRKYTYYVLLHGIIQHDLYHAGQLILLKKYTLHVK